MNSSMFPQQQADDAPAVDPHAMRVPDAARFIGVSERGIWAALSTGELPSAKVRGRRLVRVEDLRAWVDRAVTEGGAS